MQPVLSSEQVRVTEHAKRRMSQRGIRQSDIEAVMRYGRCYHARGAVFFIFGRNEVRGSAKRGVNAERLSNLQVLVEPESGQVMTVYRNPKLPKP